jgi:hypothetical protein
VLGGLGGAKAANSVKLEDLLPFKASELYDEMRTDCTPGTAKLIKKLITSGQLPISFLSLLREEMTSIPE